MFIYEWLQKWLGERWQMHGQGLNIYLHCIYTHKMDYAKGVVLLLRMRFKVDCCWICTSDKDSCGHVKCVLTGWTWEYVVLSYVATIRKHDPCSNCCSGTKIATQHYCDKKQIAHSYWLLTETAR